MKAKISKKFFLIIGFVFMATALGFMLYPTVSNAINSYFNESSIVNYNSKTSSLSAADKSEYLFAAEDYNSSLRNRVSSFSYSTNSYIDGYDDILNLENGIMGYIKIPKINVSLPIYHGSSEDVLKKGAAHIPNTAFPIGGIGNHSVISAHTGYPTQVFFDNLVELEKDDLINIYLLDECLTYKVTDINIVEPEDISLLQTDDSRDLLSLITCYPYGVNSHRLIVTAERFESNDTDSTEDEITYAQIKPYNPIPIIIAVILLCVILVVVVDIIRKKRRFK